MASPTHNLTRLQPLLGNAVNCFGSLPSREFTINLDPTSGVATINISAALSQELWRSFSANHDWFADGADEAVCRLRIEAFRILPADLLSIFQAIRSGIFAPTAVVISGLPSDQVKRVPCLGECIRDCKPGSLSECILVAFGALVGEPYSIIGEGTSLVNDLIPRIQDQYRLTGSGSRLQLGFHTENAAHRWLVRDRDLSPAALLLHGLSTPPDGPATLVSNGRIAVERLSESQRSTLRTQCVRIALPLRQRRNAEVLRTPPVPILSGKPGGETVTAAFYGDMMEPLSAKADEAISALRGEIEACAIGVRIEPGVMIYIPNTYTLHARDGFIPRFDSQRRAERWVQRIFLTTRLDAFQFCSHRTERVFELPSS
jgi:L-asparagine oxygenase